MTIRDEEEERLAASAPDLYAENIRLRQQLSASPKHSVIDGLLLRDWFAGQVIAGIGSWSPTYLNGPRHNPNLDSYDALKARAEFAYAQADWLMTARDGLDENALSDTNGK